VERTLNSWLFIPQKRGATQSRLQTARSSLGYMANVDVDGTGAERTYILEPLTQFPGTFATVVPFNIQRSGEFNDRRT
jgi:hypothetical protein